MTARRGARRRRRHRARRWLANAHRRARPSPPPPPLPPPPPPSSTDIPNEQHRWALVLWSKQVRMVEPRYYASRSAAMSVAPRDGTPFIVIDVLRPVRPIPPVYELLAAERAAARQVIENPAPDRNHEW